MQRPLHLVGQERLLQEVERPAARLEGSLEAGALAPPSALREPGVEPAFEPAGDPEAAGVRARHVVQCVERLAGIPAQAAVVPCGLLRERGLGTLDRLRDRHPHRPVAPLVDEDLDAVAGPARVRAPAPRRGRALAAQVVQGALDVLAGPEAVGAVVLALARVDGRVERADLHRVAAAVRRRDPVVPEGTGSLVERLHLDDLGLAAPLSAPDLVLVRRDPSPERGRTVVLRTPASWRGSPARLRHGAIRMGDAEPRATAQASERRRAAASPRGRPTVSPASRMPSQVTGSTGMPSANRFAIVIRSGSPATRTGSSGLAAGEEVT